MKNLIALLLALGAVAEPAFAETQANAANRVMTILQNEAHVSSQDVVYLTKQLKSSLLYDTAAHLTADTSQADGVLAYAQDTDVFYWTQNGAWVALSSLAALANGATITQSADNHLTFTENSEDVDIVFSNNLDTFSSTTGAAYAFTPAVTVTGLITANGGLVMGATVVTSTGAITSATSGQTIVVQPGTDAVITVTLPAASTKSRYCFVYDNGGTAGSTKALSIATPAGSDLIIGTTTAAGGTGFVSTAGASHGVLTTHGNAIRGDSICLAADGTNTWYQTAEVGTWASF